MSRTFRRSKEHGKKVSDKDNNEFWIKHDSTEIRHDLNQSNKASEKSYFKKYRETKYNQPPKSRGGMW